MEDYADYVKDIAAFMTPYSSRNFDTQRVTVVAIFAEMIDHCKVRLGGVDTASLSPKPGAGRHGGSGSAHTHTGMARQEGCGTRFRITRSCCKACSTACWCVWLTRTRLCACSCCWALATWPPTARRRSTGTRPRSCRRSCRAWTTSTAPQISSWRPWTASHACWGWWTRPTSCRSSSTSA